jgi:hypothetical protein
MLDRKKRNFLKREGYAQLRTNQLLLLIYAVIQISSIEKSKFYYKKGIIE